MTERERRKGYRQRAIALCSSVHGDKGAYIVNSLNRLCFLCEEIARMDNSIYCWNSNYLKSLYVKRDNWVNRLNAILSPKGETIVFYSNLPIVINAKKQDCCYRYY